MYSGFVCAYIVYIHATLSRGALLSFATFAAVFPIKKPSSLLPYLLPVPCVPFVRSRFAAVPFALLPFFCVQTFATFILCGFLSRFKRVNCVVRTFAPFALFRAVV